MTSNIHPLPHAADPLAALADRLLERHAAALPLLTEVTVLLPDLGEAPRLRRLLLAGAAARGHGALLGPRILRLADWLREVPLPTPQTLSGHARELLLVEALREHRGLFGHGNLWSLADSLLELFDELTLNRVGLPTGLDEFREQLARGYGEASRRLQALGVEARVIHTLWGAWHQQMEARGAIDAPTAHLLRLAAARPATPLYLAGFPRFSRAELAWLTPLLEQGQAELFLQGEVAGFDPAPATAATPYATLLDKALTPDETPLAERARAFAAAHPQSPAAGRLALFRADGAEEEAQAVDLQVRRWLLEGCETVAVVTENRRLARRVRALLERSGVVLQDAAGWALSTTSAASALERWLQCVEEEFPYQAMLDLLKSPFLFTGEARTERLADVYHLEQWVVLQGNVGRGLERYRHQLTQRRRLLPPELGPAMDRIAALLDLLAEAARPLLRLLGQPRRPDLLLDALLAGLEKLGLAQSLAADAAGARLLEELTGMRLAVARDTQPLAWTEFRAWVGRTLERYNFRPPAVGSQVRLMGLEQSRLGRFDAVVIAGAEHEYLPGGGGASPFFNEAVRAELGLPTAEQRRRERYHAFRHLLEAAPRLLITLRRLQDGEEIVPSPWVEGLRAFHRLGYGNELADPTLAAWLADPASQVFRCDTEALPAPPIRPAPPLPAELLPATLSASGYQQLIDCPYQFFAARGLGLAPPEAIREALEKADYGERVHLSLQAFHAGVPGLPGPFARPLTPANRDEAEVLLRAIAEAIFQPDLAENFLHRGWLQRWQAAIPLYIDWQLARDTEGWRFDSAERELAQEGLAPGLVLKGRLDRLDRSPAGAGIVDYKTGRAPGQAEVEEGEAVQLPFYALLAEGPVARVEYLGIDRKKVASGATLEGDALAGLRAANGQRLATLWSELREGRPLPAWGDEGSCAWCDMEGVCRRAMWQGGTEGEPS